MGETLLLSPGELYYLGWLMKAEYIDYAYAAAATGAGGSFRLFARSASAALAGRGILQEDFSGGLQLDPAAARLLRPIFFGGRELTVDLCRLDGDKSVTAYKFHFFGDLAVMVRCQGDTLAISGTNSQGILAAIAGLLPQGEANDAPGPGPEAVSRVLVVKCVCIGGDAQRELFVMDSRGVLCREVPEGTRELPGGTMETVGAGDVLDLASRMLEVCTHGVS